MALPLGNLRSKHNRAVCAWLAANGCGVIYQSIFPANSGVGATRAFPNITVRSPMAHEEVHETGTDEIKFQLEIKGSATAIEGASAGRPRVNFDTLCAKAKDAMSMSQTGVDYDYVAAQITAAGNAMATAVDSSTQAIAFAAENADMVNYTCQKLYAAGEGDGEITEADANAGCSFHDVYLFRAIACPYVVTMN